MAHRLGLQRVYWNQPQQGQVPVRVVTLGGPKEAQAAQRFGGTKRVGVLLYWDLLLWPWSVETRKGCICGGVEKRKKHPPLSVLASGPADREARGKAI